MNFHRGRQREEPEINLIPMIDVLLVILIFLMVTITYTHFSELQINLPQADAEQAKEKPEAINVGVDATGHYMINNTPVSFSSVDLLGQELRRAAGANADPTIVINADAKATHQSVVNIMEGARQVGLTHITFATQAKK